jgi:hypothetical protein
MARRSCCYTLSSKDSSIDPKICGEFDSVAASGVTPKTNGAGPLQCLINPAVEREEVRDVVALPAVDDVLRSFNRDTAWLATGILGGVVCAALVLAVALIQEGHPKAVDQTKEERQTSGKASVIATHAPRRDGDAQHVIGAPPACPGDGPVPTPVGLERDGKVLIKPFCPRYHRDIAGLAFVDYKYAPERGRFRDGGE